MLLSHPILHEYFVFITCHTQDFYVFIYLFIYAPVLILFS
jgi:hypothetical protein